MNFERPLLECVLLPSERETSTFLDCVLLPFERETSTFLDCVLYVYEICLGEVQTLNGVLHI